MGEQFDVNVSVKNPLPSVLNGAKFIIEGAGLGSPHKIALPKSVAVGQEANATVKMTATKVGEKTISVKFYSNEINDVDGYLVVNVVDENGI